MASTARRPGRDARLDDGDPLAGFLATPRRNARNRTQGSIRVHGPAPYRRRDHADRRRAVGADLGPDLQRPGRLRAADKSRAGLVGLSTARVDDASPFLRFSGNPALEIHWSARDDIEALLAQ